MSEQQPDFPAIDLKPVISYPREAQAGETYLMTIDVQLATPGAPWPYPEEEYPISFILDTQPYFSYEPLDSHERSVVLHRFGGTYGPVQYVLTATAQAVELGHIYVILINSGGLPIGHMELECEVKEAVRADKKRKIRLPAQAKIASPLATSTTPGSKQPITLSGHTSSVLSCAFSPNGHFIVSTSGDYILKVWDASTGAERFSLRGHAASINSCAVSPDGHFIVSASDDRTLKLWDANTGAERLTLRGHTDRVHGCAVSPDGRFVVSASADHTLKFWNTSTGMEYLTLGGHTDRVNDCAISPDGRFIASASSDHTLKIWDTATGAEYFSLTGHKGVVNNCAISPDGRFVVSASADGTLKLWDLTTLVGNFSPGRPTGSALIEAQLKQVGWVISPYGMGLNTELWQDVAFSDFPNLSDGYLLFVQGQPVGVIKVRRIGDPLAGIEEPVLSSTLFPANGDGSRSPLRHILPFVYESTGIDTRFTSYLDSDPRSREVFTFHQPKTLALWLSQAPLSVPSTSNNTLRSRLRQLPSRPVRGLQKPQLEALANLEKSLAENKPRALIQTISGRNKTNMVLTSIYRLLEYGGALHILYIADRESQARYISDQFHKHAITTISPQGEKFSRMKTQLFQSDSIDPLARVYITTIEHLSSLFSRTSNDVHYNPKIPIETFDIIFIDDGNLSVNPRWRPILEYFDAFLIGLGIPSNTKARGFFNNNIVYGQLTEQPRALILTVLAGERQAVQVHLTDLKKEIFRDSIYSRGAFTSENQTWDILITQCAMGNMNITSEIQKAIDYFNPQIIVSVGLGAGLKDTKIGDVVVATRIYLHGSEAFSGVRVDVFGRTNRIMRLAQAIASSGDWQRRSRNQASNAFLSSIISSEKIIDSLNLRELLRSAHPDARALDMESAGILATLRRYSSIKTLVVRGISDFADGAKIDSFQEVAAQHASAFAFALLARLELTESLQSKKESEDDDEYYGLVALSYDELEHFLRDQENEYWLVDKRSIEEFITGRPANVEELMYAIAMNGDTTQRVYLFRSDMSPEDVIAATDLEDIPEITREDIDDEYIISSKGSDFLAFDCSVDEASNCSPATLFPYEDYKDGEDVESSASGVETIHPRFSTWLANQQETRTQPFTEEQVLWLNRIRDRIIADGSFKVQDFERAPFTFDGGLVAAHHLFGNELSLLLQDLNGLLKQEE